MISAFRGERLGLPGLKINCYWTLAVTVHMDACFGRLGRSPISSLASLALVALCLSAPGFGGEIHDAVSLGDVEKMKTLLKGNSALVSDRNNDGETPLHVAAACSRVDIAKLLLANKAEVDALMNSGQTPLHIAASKGRKDIAELLFASKADVNAKDDSGWTSLHYASANGHEELTKILRQYGAHKETEQP